MNLRSIFMPLLIAGLLVASYVAYGWSGVAAVSGGVVMWALLHFTRLVNVMRKASNTPMGYVGSAVMLNAKLKPGVNLMHVIAMTRSLGEQLSPKDTDPEIYRWTDGTHSSVTCEFRAGKLAHWEMVRPAAESSEKDAPAPAIAP